MAAIRMPSELFVIQLAAALDRKDGYIMGATGQNPSKWPTNSWWFTQYSGKQHEKALYWREYAQRVWDCNGLAEGIYKDFSGIDINSKARYNYRDWCSVKGIGLIPENMRVPGAAVFWGDSASSITHVAYLWKPVRYDKPTGDWYLIEARGVMYGVVKTKLLDRSPKYWGLMTKYYDYGETESAIPEEAKKPELGNRILKNGMAGEDVKEMQSGLIRLGYDLGRWGADGDFGDATELAVREFQDDHALKVDGEFGPKTLAKLEQSLARFETPSESPRYVLIEGGNCYVRSAPSKETGNIYGVAHRGDKLLYGGLADEETGWFLVQYGTLNGWVSCKYGKLVAG